MKLTRDLLLGVSDCFLDKAYGPGVKIKVVINDDYNDDERQCSRFAKEVAALTERFVDHSNREVGDACCEASSTTGGERE